MLDLCAVADENKGSFIFEESLAQVTVSDWKKALQRAPKPCSQRQGFAALSSSQTLAVPYHISPLLLQTLSQSLQILNAAGISLPACVAAICPRLKDSLQDESCLENALMKLGAIQADPTNTQAGQFYPGCEPPRPLDPESGLMRFHTCSHLNDNPCPTKLNFLFQLQKAAFCLGARLCLKPQTPIFCGVSQHCPAIVVFIEVMFGILSLTGNRRCSAAPERRKADEECEHQQCRCSPYLHKVKPVQQTTVYDTLWHFLGVGAVSWARLSICRAWLGCLKYRGTLKFRPILSFRGTETMTNMIG